MQDITFNQSPLFVQFLKDHPLISIRAFELKINAPRGTIEQAISGRREIPKKYWYACYLTLTDYGFESQSVKIQETDL